MWLSLPPAGLRDEPGEEGDHHRLLILGAGRCFQEWRSPTTCFRIRRLPTIDKCPTHNVTVGGLESGRLPVDHLITMRARTLLPRVLRRPIPDTCCVAEQTQRHVNAEMLPQEIVCR